MSEKKEKKDAAVVGGQQAPDVLSFEEQYVTTDIIPQTDTSGQVEIARKGKNGRGKKVLKADAKPYSVALKFYEEQMPNGLDFTKKQLQSLDKKEFQAVGIVHDRDLVEDDVFWETSFVKRHVHIIIRATERKKRFRLSTMLNRLGIVYRRDIDDDLWRNHGVETVGNFSGFLCYLTHETEDAIRAGKELYSVDELWSNLTNDEIKQVRDGYSRLTQSEHKVTIDELIKLDADALELGRNFGDFNDWFSSQPFIVRCNVKMKTIMKSYYRGVEMRLEEKPEIVRLCIFIHGEPNTGKTYAAETALSGKKIHIIRGGGSGKFDSLRVNHEAVLVDDDVVPNLLNVTDNYPCFCYRRNQNNPIWCGAFFVVTSNNPFHVWLQECGLKITDGLNGFTRHYRAMESRFYVCDVVTDEKGISHLACRSVSTRGSPEVQQERLEMFSQFKKKFDSVISTYMPNANRIDYSSVIEPK